MFLAVTNALIPPHPQKNANPCHKIFSKMHEAFWYGMKHETMPHFIEDLPRMMSIAKAEIMYTWRSVQ